MNSDVIVSYSGGTARNTIASQVLASTTETEFQLNTDTAGTTSIAVLQVPQQGGIVGSSNPQDNQAQPALLMGGLGRQSGQQPNSNRPYYNSSLFDGGRPFIVTLCGTFTPASNAGNTLQFKLYCGTSKSGQNIAATGAVPEATTTSTQNFILQAQLNWDSTSQAVNGQFWWSVPGTSGTTYVTWAVATQATAVAVAGLQFCATAKWGNGAGGTVAVSEFTIARG